MNDLFDTQDGAELLFLKNNFKELKSLYLEAEKRIRDLETQNSRYSSHLESEMGNITRTLDKSAEKIDKIFIALYGEGETKGLYTRVDRLEQESKRKNKYNFIFISCFIALIGDAILGHFSILK